MFLVKREYFNKSNIIKGLLIALMFSAFIYLAYFNIYNKFINTLFALVSLYFILKANKQVAFYIGFFIGLFWFYWVSISLQYYDLIYLAPLIVFVFAFGYAVVFYLLCYFESIYLRVIILYFLSFIHPFGFNWFVPELIFIDSYFSISKEHFALILASLLMLIKLKKLKILFLIPLFFALSNNSIIENKPNIKIDMPKLMIEQDQKWMKSNLENVINKNFELIEKSIINKNDLIILPETTFPVLLNSEEFLMEKLLNLSFDIDIVLGGLYLENDQFYNASYHFSKGSFTIAKKVVLVPFGEEIPLPKYFVDLINDIFYNGAKDYNKAIRATDFEIKNIKFRNAICYEATSDKIFENLNNTKFMIAISNNAWFTPSTEPILQKLLLKYYAKKYNITIYHQINGSENYIVRP